MLPLIPIIGAVQAVTGIVKGANAAADAKRLRAQRQSFKTSQEVFDIQNATENAAQSGYDAQTLGYLTNQIERAGSGALGTAKRLGGNPNDLSALFDQQIEGLLKVGAGNAAARMETFSKYVAGKELLSKNLDAEWASKQAMLKDDLQAAAQSKQEAAQQISGGLNTIVGGISAMKTEQLYRERTDAIAGAYSGATAASASPVFTTQGSTLDASTNLPVDASASPVFSTQGRTLDASTNLPMDAAVQSVSSMVTPNMNFSRRMIIGYDNGVPVYRR